MLLVGLLLRLLLLLEDDHLLVEQVLEFFLLLSRELVETALLHDDGWIGNTVFSGVLLPIMAGFCCSPWNTSTILFEGICPGTSGSESPFNSPSSVSSSGSTDSTLISSFGTFSSLSSIVFAFSIFCTRSETGNSALLGEV